ncbi:MAG: DUF6626 family protein [Magnetovibrionaceae bacterium]
MDILNEVYDELHCRGMVSSHNEFSVKWLNKSARYMSMIRASDQEVTLDTLGRLAANLKVRNDACKSSRYGELREKVVWLQPLTNKVWTALYHRALERQQIS